MSQQSTQKLKLLPASASLLLAFAIAGCTAQQGYQSAQGWQQNQCNQMVDQRDREQCLSKTTTSYEDYKREAAKAKD
jgi:hypothetical protein